MVTFRSSIVTAVLLVVLGISTVYTQSSSRTYVYSTNAKQGYLGVEVNDVTQRLKERKQLSTDRGAFVTNVIEDSPAEKAGIQEGDVIVKLDDQTIDDGEDLTRSVRKIKPGTDVKVEVFRKADKKILTATVKRVPAPEAYAYGWNGSNIRPMIPRIPRIPKMPKMPRSLGNLHVYMNHDNQELYGLEVQDLTRQLGEFLEVPEGRGVLVAEVEKGSDAEKAGFKAGDVITKVDNHTIRGIEDLHEELYDNESDKDRDVPFDVVRKGKPATLKMHVLRDAEDRDGENGGNDGDEDDDSQNFTIPHGHDGARSFRFETSPSYRFDFNDLRETLQNLKRDLRENLREQLRDIKESIRNIIAQVSEDGSSFMLSSFLSVLGQPVVPLLNCQPHVVSCS